MKKISIVVPSINIDDLMNMLIPSIHNISTIQEQVDVTFVVVYQDPWDRESVEKARENFNANGFNSIFVRSSKIGHMCHLRNKGIYATECDYFMQIDDNFIFTEGTKQYPYSSGERYLQVIEYLENFTECGMVQCEGTLGGSIQKLRIQSTQSFLFSTQRGIIYRYIPGYDYYGDCINNPASAEESVIGMRLVEHGHFFAKQFNNPTRHKTENKKKLVSNSVSPIHDQDVIEANNVKYLRDRYDDENYTNNNNKLPKKVKKLFTKNGGNPRVFKEKCYIIDF